MVEFDKDCKWENFMTPNFTAISLRARTHKALSAEVRMSQPEASQEAAQREEAPLVREDRLQVVRNGS